MGWYWRQYLGEGADGSADPDISPAALQDLRRLPRAIVVPPRRTAPRRGRDLRAAAVPGRRRDGGYRYDGMVHGFLRMAGGVERSDNALDELAESLAAALAKGRREEFGGPEGA